MKQRLFAGLRGLARILRNPVPDVLAVIGCVLMAYGMYLIAPPAGLIWGGLECVLAAVVVSMGEDGDAG